MAKHPLNTDPYARPSSEAEYGTRHPARYEARQPKVGSTQSLLRMRAHVHGSAATQSIPDNAATDVVFDTVDFDTAGLLASNQFIIPSTGKVTGAWLIHAHVTWASAAAGLREVDLLANGSVVASSLDVGGTTAGTSLDVTLLVNDPNTGTAYKVQAKQTSGGGALNLDKAASRTYFEIIHLW